MKSIKTQGYYQTQLLFYFKFLATCFRSYTPSTIKLRVKNCVKVKNCILCHTVDIGVVIIYKILDSEVSSEILSQ